MRSEKISLIIGIAVTLVLLVSTVMLYRLDQKVLAGAASGTQEEGTGAPVLELIAIQASECDKCADVQQIVDAFKQAPTLNIAKDSVIESDTDEAKALIKEYDIKRLPAIILKGDIANLPAEAPRVKDAVVIDQLSPPLYDLENETVEGLVDITILSAPLCIKCANLSSFADQLVQTGIGVDNTKTVAYDSKEGAALVKKYGIEQVPTVILSEGIGWYPQITQSWDQMGDVVDGNYILREAMPPYIDLKTGAVRGLVNATFITDKSCDKCYDVAIHEQILGGFGMDFQVKNTVDVGSAAGKAVLKKYNITLVPTVLVTGDTDAYVQLLSMWDQVGTQEDDGTLVFRSPEVLSMTYKDLSTGKLIEAPEQDLGVIGAPQDDSGIVLDENALS